jgi:hypothetical protein
MDSPLEDYAGYSGVFDDSEYQAHLESLARFRRMNVTLVLNDVHRKNKTEHEVTIYRHAVVFECLTEIFGEIDRLETVENNNITVDAGTRWGELHVLPDGSYELDLYFARSDESSNDGYVGSPGSAYTSDDDAWFMPDTQQFQAPPNLGLDETPVQPTPVYWGFFADNLGIVSDDDEVY